MSKRVLEDREWESHKAEIVRLYRETSLAEVMTAMQTSAGFVRTKGQYERRLKAWRINKYSKSDDWKFIASRYRARQLDGRQTIVEIRGERIEDCKVRKEIARQGYESTLERLVCRARLPTPPEIHLYTPPRSPVALENGPEKVSHASHSFQQPTRLAWTDSLLLELADVTPWHRFITTVQPLSAGCGTLLTLPHDHIHSIPPSIVNKLNGDLVSVTRNSKIRAWYDDILCSRYITPEFLHFQYHPACLDPTNYLPPSQDAASQIDINAFQDLTTRCSQLEFLKHAMHLVSNNFDSYNGTVCSAIAELLREHRNRLLLQSLIDQKLITAMALLEKLVVPAIKNSNIALLRMIIANGWNIQEKIISSPRRYRLSALQVSIELDSEEAVEFLLSHGANGSEHSIVVDNQRAFDCKFWIHNIKYENFLELAASYGRFNLVRRLVTPKHQFGYGVPQITILVLQFAILYGDVESFRFFLTQARDLHCQIHAKPWLLLEFAALQKSHAMFSEVLRFFSDTHELDSASLGGVLSAAYMSKDLDRVKILRDMGAGHYTVAESFRKNIQAIYQFLNRKPYHMPILHLATENDDLDTVVFLINHGVDVNQRHASLCPLQIALYRRNELIVQILLEAGADVDIVDEIVDVGVYIYDLEDAAGRPNMRLALESGSPVNFEKLIQYGSDITRFTDTDLLKWAIEGRNSKLVDRIICDFISTAHFPSYIPAKLVSSFGFETGFQLIRKLPAFDPAVVFDVEVLYKVISHHDPKHLREFLTQANMILGDLPPRYASSGLAYACRKNYLDLLEIFLEAGAKPYEMPLNHQQDPNQSTIFVNCALVEFTKIWEVLPLHIFKFNTLVNACDRPEHTDEQMEWKTALFRVCCSIIIYRGNLRVHKILEKGLDVNWIPADQASLLQTALKYGRQDLATDLLRLGAEPDAPAISTRDETYHTPLQYSARLPDDSFLDLLLQKGATTFASPALSHGATATQFAAISGNFRNISILLKHGVDINEPPGDHEGRTAIEGAAEHGRLDMVKFLLAVGARVQGKTNVNYRRTIYRAWANGHRAIANMVQEWKAQRYGLGDCDSIEMVVRTMTKDELQFESPAAKVRMLEWVNSWDPGNDWLDTDLWQEKEFQDVRKQFT